MLPTPLMGGPGGLIPPDIITAGGLIATSRPLPVVDPATNDAPLDFNTPAMRQTADFDDTQLEEDRWMPCSPGSLRSNQHCFANDQDDRIGVNRPDSSAGVRFPGAARYSNSAMPLPNMSTLPLDGVQPQWSMVYPMVPMGADPNMMPVIPMNFNQYSFMGTPDASLGSIPPLMSVVSGGPVKEIIHCKSCTLFPPNPSSPVSSTRERPPGCRTVFVGGLPEIITEDIIHEIFDRCGEISIIRMSKKNFCHIRFTSEEHVDSALFLSGYRIRIGSNTDPPNTGRLHVDYAQARDDLYEWECRQRQMQREQRHRERVEKERMREPSPPPVIHYNEHEAAMLADKLKGTTNQSSSGKDQVIARDGEGFYKALQTLITWLDRGDCNKRNSVQFYGMIQSTNSHVRRLMSEKNQLEDELQRAKERLRCEVHEILLQFNQIEKVFFAASRQKVWDHFTKAQRKNIDMWRKQAEEIKKMQLEDALKFRVEDEMDLSDDDGNSPNKKSKSDGETGGEEVSMLRNNVSSLQEENDSLKCQLEAYKNEIDLIKADNKQEIENKETQMRALKQALQGMQQKLVQAEQQRQKDEDSIFMLKKNFDELNPAWDNRDSQGQNPNESQSSKQLTVTESEAQLIGLLSTFLNVHPFGATVDYIWSYLHRLNSGLTPRDVESLLLKFPSVFRLEYAGVGATLERKWLFTGFDK